MFCFASKGPHQFRCECCSLCESRCLLLALRYVSPVPRPAPGFDIPAVHSAPAPSSRLGRLPGLQLDMKPSFLPTNSWSSSLITRRHSDSLRCQLGCISLSAVRLMLEMLVPCLLQLWPGTVFNGAITGGPVGKPAALFCCALSAIFIFFMVNKSLRDFI